MSNEEALKLLGESQIRGVALKDSKLPLAEAVDMAIVALEKQEKFNHIIFQIGETLVDESKNHISSAEAVSKIRKILRETNYI